MMTAAELAAHGIMASCYIIEGSDIRIELRGYSPEALSRSGAQGDLWSVTNGGRSCLNSDLEWEYEPSPSGRTEDYKKRNRFSLDECFRMALHEVKSRLIKSGLTSGQKA